MTYTGRHCPKEVHFSGVRYVKGYREFTNWSIRKGRNIYHFSTEKTRLMAGCHFSTGKVYETVNFRLQALRGLYNFIRGFRRAYRQGALLFTYYFDQHSLRRPIFAMGKNGKNPLVWGIVWGVPSPRTAFPRPSRSMHFGDVFEANTRARITWPETHSPRGIMRPRD